LLYQTIVKTTDHKIVFGASYMYDHYNELFKDSLIKRTESVPGAFGEYTYSYKDVFSVIAGFRYDYHNMFGSFYTPRIHLRYKIGALTTFRASAGKGYRVPNTFSENASLLATSKKLVFDEKLLPEEAWNYGVFLARDILIKKFKATINLDYHRTDFTNQSIVDMDRFPGEIHFYNLKGKSFSNSFQAELNIKPVKRLDILLAYRINDVRSTYNGEVKSKPLTKKEKALLTISYATKYEKWQFDYTLQYNGRSRMPDTSLTAPEVYSPDYFIMNGQILKRFKKFELYLGMENMLDFMQMETIVGSTDPFGTEFDATKIWGPIMGRKIYGGIRFIIK
jgi:outer membrane receptor for ferrienterochelin and colicins